MAKKKLQPVRAFGGDIYIDPFFVKVRARNPQEAMRKVREKLMKMDLYKFINKIDTTMSDSYPY